MTSLELAICLGEIRGEFITEARHPEQGKSQGLRRIWLIAAVIVLAALLVGCAVVYALRLENLRIGQLDIPKPHTVTEGTDPVETEATVEVLSLQGIRGSVNYQANQEWLNFTQSYTPKPISGWGSSPEYWAYSLQDQTMVDKLNEICEKYGLKIIGKSWHEHQDCSHFLKLAGIDSLVKPEYQSVFQQPQGRFFPGGSFTVYGQLNLEGDEMPLFITYQYVKKDVFYDVFGYVRADGVTQKSITTEDGIPLLLLESGQSGMIFAEKDDCFITIGVDTSEAVSLEEIAGYFDFSIQSSPLNTTAADAREQESLALSQQGVQQPPTSYTEYIQRKLESYSTEPNGSLALPEYTFYDLDGNGEDDLLIVKDGKILEIPVLVSGEIDNGKSYALQLCQDNVLIEKDSYYLTNETWYHIFRFANNGDPVFSNPKEQSIVRLKKDGQGQWWRTSSTDHYADFDTQITEAEAMKILNAYQPVELDTKPLSEFQEP